MMSLNEQLKRIKVVLIIAFAASIIFYVLNTEKTIEGYFLTLGISSLYSIGFVLGNYFLNDFLNKKYSWTDQTRQRTISAVIGTLLVNIVLTYGLNYINLVLIQGLPKSDFFSPKVDYINWLMINFALMIAAVLHARGFLKAMKIKSKRKSPNRR